MIGLQPSINILSTHTIEQTTKLHRGLNLPQATALNMIDMVGIGPFVVMSFIIGAMNGPACILAWVLGAVLSLCDGLVWSELGSAYPEAGGSYVFLQKLYGAKWGKLMSFLYVWQTTIQAPLVIASGAIGFSSYLMYIIPIDPWQQKAVSGALVILITFLLYRDIKTTGKMGVVMSLIVIGVLLFLIVSGFTHFDTQMAFGDFSKGVNFSSVFFVGLGAASVKSMYSFLGYYNVCHLGGEIKSPEKNIPKSIIISLIGIAVIYICMQTAVLGVLPWKEAANSKFVASLFFERIYGHTVALFATGLILIVAISSLFAVMLGYSRVLFAAAADGNYFSIFAKVHPRLKIPHYSLLILGAFAFVFSLLFKMAEVISAILAMRILVQFVSQGVGIILLHRKKTSKEILKFRMPLFPVPAVFAVIVWGYIYFSTDWKFIFGSLGMIALGAIVYMVWKGKELESK